MAIDRKRIIAELSKIRVTANEEGLIPAFGVYIQQLPAGFWNSFAQRIVNSVTDDLLPEVEGLLVNAAHECGYHTGRGIILSDEWEKAVAPMVENEPEDILHGAFAVLTAWGWADSEIAELVPAEKMVVRAHDYYEADIMIHGKNDRPSAYMIRGITGAFMDLAYGSRPYPDGIYTFECEQTKGVECGDEYGEFVVRRADR